MTVPPIAWRSSTELNLARHMGQLLARSTQGLRQALCRSCPQGRRWATISSSSSILKARCMSVLRSLKSRLRGLEASSDSATCAEQRESLTFQAHPANVFKPSKSGSRSVAEVAEPLQASGVQYPCEYKRNRITCAKAQDGQSWSLLGGGGGTFWW